MVGRKRTSGTLAIGIALPIFALFILPTGFVGEATALTWTQSTQSEFESGMAWNVDTASSMGDVSLMPSQTDWIKYALNPVLTNAAVGSVVLEGSTYRLYFERGAAVHLATSPDGKTWTEDPGNPVFTAQLPWEMGSISEPNVVREIDGSYSMWYRGAFTGSGQIGHATSPDGVTWDRADTPVLSPSAGWESSGVFGPSVLFEPGRYRMWYEGFDGGILRIGYAESSDGNTWNKSPMNPLPMGGPSGSWDIAVAHPRVVRAGAGLQMLYVGCESGSCGPGARVGLAFSTDGLSWTKHPNNPILSAGQTGAWDDALVAMSVFLPRPGGFDILYTGAPGGIGLATAAYAERFVRAPGNPLINLGPLGSWDDAGIRMPTVVRHDGLYRMWYSGLDGNNARIGYAFSSDGLRWTKPLLGLHAYAGSLGTNIVLDLAADGRWDDADLLSPTVIWDGSLYQMWYTGSDGGAARIGHATSSDGTTWTKSIIGRFDYGGDMNNGIVLDLGSSGQWDDRNHEGIDVQWTGSNYTMWYSGRRNSPGANSVGAAFSPDGRDWTRYANNPVLTPQGMEGDVEDLTVHFAGTGYSMWYEGLSGGVSRFFLANSDDGLTWMRSPANPILEESPPGNWDGDEIRHPDALLDSGVYFLWYTGRQGGALRAGTAVSVDGVSWTKRALNPVMSASPSSWDDYSVRSPSIVKDGETYRMWYEAHTSSTLWRFRIGYAESPDGNHWSKHPDPVLTANASNPWESYWVNVPHVIKVGDGYKMWYVGTADPSLGHRIGYAESDNGIDWIRPSPVPALDLGPPGSWDSARIIQARVLLDHGIYRMLYAGSDTGGADSVGYAESTDGRNWTKYSGNPVLTLGPPGSWDGATITPNHFEKIGSTFFLWYTGWDGSANHVGIAKSVDALNWTKSLLNPILGRGPMPDAWDLAHVMQSALVTEPRRLTMWYSGSFDSSYRVAIGRAESDHWGVGTLESSVFDSGNDGTLWETIAWNATLPPDTRIHFAVRSGDSPDLSSVGWSAEVLASGSSLSVPRSRYVQYRATLVSLSGLDTPILHEVTLDYEPNSGPMAQPVSPTGCVATPTPALTWAYSDPEGDPQAAFHVQVDDDPGFSSPEVDANASGSAPSYDLAAALADGAYEWRVETADNFGFWSGYDGSLAFGVDTAAPSTDLEVGVPFATVDGTTFVTSSTPMTITATDGCAGISITEYRLLLAGYWTEWQAYDGSFTLPDVGEITIEFRSTDSFGRDEEVRSASVIVDNDPPETAIVVGSPRFDLNGILYVGPSAEFSLFASDSGSGVGATSYRFNGGPWIPYTIPFVPVAAGPITVEAMSVDRLGNPEVAVALDVLVDQLPPNTVVAVIGPSLESGGVTHVTTASHIVLRATDVAVGVEGIRYRIDNGAWTPYSVPFALAGEGAHTLDAQATDRLGNVEAVKRSNFNVDDALPTSTLEIGTPNAGTNPTVVTSVTPFTLAATDAGSGLASIRFRLDGGAWTDYTGPFTLAGSSQGLHVLQYDAIDRLGNLEDPNVRTVQLDDTPPLADAGPDSTVPKGTTVVLTSSASTDDSGIASQTWTFTYGGNPVTLSGPVVSFRFDRAGTYVVTLEVTDLVGHVSSDTTTVIVWNRAPLPSLVASPRSAETGVPIEFNASASEDPDGSIGEYCFEFGDAATSCGPTTTASHAYASGGAYTATMTVTDDDGATATVTTTVFVRNRAPIADAGSDRDAFKRSVVALDGALSSDPEGGALTFLWTQLSGFPVTLTGPNTAAASFTPTAADTYVFILRVSDEEVSDEDAVVVKVSNRAPAITSATPSESVRSIRAGETQTFNVIAVDADGDPLAIAWTVGGVPAGTSRTFDFSRPAGRYVVNVSVSDGDAAAWREWTVNVSPAPLQPSLDVRDFSLILALAFLIVIAYLIRKVQKARGANEMSRDEEAPSASPSADETEGRVEAGTHHPGDVPSSGDADNEEDELEL